MTRVRATVLVLAGLFVVSAVALSSVPVADRSDPARPVALSTDVRLIPDSVATQQESQIGPRFPILQEALASATADCAPGTDPAAGTLQFSSNTLTVAEGAGDRALLVVRDDGSAGPVSAAVSTADGTATSSADYLPVAGSVTFPDGDDTVRVVRVPIVQDLLPEPNETLTVELFDPSCGTLGVRSSVQITIIDDDPIHRFGIGGTVRGLQGSGLQLRDLTDDITAINGPFVFPQALDSGSGYAVTVRAQPVDPDQTCTVSNGTGVVTGTEVTDVAVDCVTRESNPRLDPGFGTDGKVSTPGVSGAEAVAVQPDGKIVAAGSFSLTRYNADGSLDVGFAAVGTVRTGITGGFLGDAIDVAIQPDGSIVVVGVRDNGSATGEDFAVQRYDPGGILDPGFGTGGTVTTDFNGGTDRAYAVAVQPDGSIVVAGHATTATRTGSEFALARYTAAGVLDQSFGTGGRVTTDVQGEASFGFAAALAPGGEIIVAGRVSTGGGSGDEIGVARYHQDGSLDETFDGDGKSVTGFGLGAIPHGVAVDGQGGIVVVGQSLSALPGGRSDVAVVRFDAVGGLDDTFDGDGLVTTDFADSAGVSHDEFGRDLALQADGRIVVVGVAQLDRGADFALARYQPDGTLDPSFGTGGRMAVDFHAGFDSGRDVAIQPDGRIVAAGSAINVFSPELALIRLTP